MTPSSLGETVWEAEGYESEEHYVATTEYEGLRQLIHDTLGLRNEPVLHFLEEAGIYSISDYMETGPNILLDLKFWDTQAQTRQFSKKTLIALGDLVTMHLEDGS